MYLIILLEKTLRIGLMLPIGSSVDWLLLLLLLLWIDLDCNFVTVDGIELQLLR